MRIVMKNGKSSIIIDQSLRHRYEADGYVRADASEENFVLTEAGHDLDDSQKIREASQANSGVPGTGRVKESGELEHERGAKLEESEHAKNEQENAQGDPVDPGSVTLCDPNGQNPTTVLIGSDQELKLREVGWSECT